MNHHHSTLAETASQTAGPYIHIGCLPRLAGIAGIYTQEIGLCAIETGARGRKITITGAIYDGHDEKIHDAILESWQPDNAGIFPGQAGADPAVNGFCRFAPDPQTGEFTLHTVRPGPVPNGYGRLQAPHVALWIVARGLNNALTTRIYFDDDDHCNDPLFERIEPCCRAETLRAQSIASGCYRFDIRLQGERETVFLDM